jgi:glycerol-3-phosphate acyltransferase PlsY
LAINPIITVTLFVFWIILKKITNYTSVSSIIGCFIAPFLILIKMWDVRGYLYYWFKLSINQDDLWFFLAIFFIFLVASWITIFMHKSNIGRLLKGNENKIRTKTLAK